MRAFAALARLAKAEQARDKLGINKRDQLKALKEELRMAKQQAKPFTKRKIDEMRELVKSTIDASNSQVNHAKDNKKNNEHYFESLRLQDELDAALRAIQKPAQLKQSIDRLEKTL